MTLPAEIEARVRRLVLGNAVEHDAAPRVAPILSRVLATEPALRSRAREVEAMVGRLVAEVSELSAGDRATALAALGGAESSRPRPDRSESGDFPDLPGAVDGHVVLRFAPFPSGALHVGHARAIFVNDYYRTRYHGKLLLVFDDTIGSEEKRVDAELFDLIAEDLERAEVRPDAVYYKSDRLPLFYPVARQLIEKGFAYVCVCPATVLRDNRAAGVACPERAQTPGEALDAWERMLQGGYGPGEAVLRLKSSLRDPDPAFRDRVLLRISDLDHPRVGRKYRVWPMLEFSWAVDDVALEVTHVIRGKDLVIEDRMEEFIWHALGVSGPPFIHWGLLRIREAKLSKSKFYQEVKSGRFDGWADPRTWSLRSLDRRGISMEALRRFSLSFGMSLADIEVPAETLYAENRTIIDPLALRRAFVPDPVRVEIAGYPSEVTALRLANHPDRPELGERSVPAGSVVFLARSDLLPRAGSEVRLKDLLNLTLPGEIPDRDPGTVRATFTTRENRRLPRLQWVGEPGAISVDLLDVDGSHRTGVGEASLRDARPGELFQFERVGFVRVDTQAPRGSDPLRVVFGHP